MFENITIKRKQALNISKLLYSGVEMELEGQNSKIKNPLKLQENQELIKNKLVELFYPEILEDKEIGSAGDLNQQEFETKLKEILEYAEKENVKWILDFNLNKKPEDLSEKKTK